MPLCTEEFCLDGEKLLFKGLGLDELPQRDSVYGGLSTDPRILQDRGVNKKRKERNKQETTRRVRFLSLLPERETDRNSLL